MSDNVRLEVRRIGPLTGDPVHLGATYDTGYAPVPVVPVEAAAVMRVREDGTVGEWEAAKPQREDVRGTKAEFSFDAGMRSVNGNKAVAAARLVIDRVDDVDNPAYCRFVVGNLGVHPLLAPDFHRTHCWRDSYSLGRAALAFLRVRMGLHPDPQHDRPKETASAGQPGACDLTQPCEHGDCPICRDYLAGMAAGKGGEA